MTEGYRVCGNKTDIFPCCRRLLPLTDYGINWEKNFRCKKCRRLEIMYLSVIRDVWNCDSKSVHLTQGTFNNDMLREVKRDFTKAIEADYQNAWKDGKYPSEGSWENWESKCRVIAAAYDSKIDLNRLPFDKDQITVPKEEKRWIFYFLQEIPKDKIIKDLFGNVQIDPVENIKIGHAYVAQKRSRGLNTGNSKVLEVLYECPEDNSKWTEAKLLKKFIDFRVPGRGNEWRFPVPELISFIENLRAGG